MLGHQLLLAFLGSARQNGYKNTWLQRIDDLQLEGFYKYITGKELQTQEDGQMNGVTGNEQ
jgi:hypothetical protein